MPAIAPTKQKTDYSEILSQYQPSKIENEKDYNYAISVVNELMDIAQMTESQTKLLRLFVTLIKEYEIRNYYPVEKANPREVLKYLMKKRGVKQVDLIDVIGSKGVVSEVVNGKRKINVKQAHSLGEFFNVSPASFI